MPIKRQVDVIAPYIEVLFMQGSIVRTAVLVGDHRFDTTLPLYMQEMRLVYIGESEVPYSSASTMKRMC